MEESSCHLILRSHPGICHEELRKTHNKPHSGRLGFWTRLELETSWIQSRSANHSTGTFDVTVTNHTINDELERICREVVVASCFIVDENSKVWSQSGKPSYPDWSFHDSPQFLQVNARIVPSSRPQLLPSTINSFIIVLSLNNIKPKKLTNHY